MILRLIRTLKARFTPAPKSKLTSTADARPFAERTALDPKELQRIEEAHREWSKPDNVRHILQQCGIVKPEPTKKP